MVVGAAIQAWTHKQKEFPVSEKRLKFKLMIHIPIQVQYASSVVQGCPQTSEEEWRK